MKIWQIIETSRSSAAPWPVRMARGVLAIFLAFGLIAGVAWLGFGRSAETQVMDVAEGLIEIAGIVLVPILIFGFVAVPFHRWFMRKVIGGPGTADVRSPITEDKESR